MSKAIGEDLASLYAQERGVRGFCMRIGGSSPASMNPRSVHPLQSRGDFVRLVRTGLTADHVHEIVYGVSDNPEAWWDNSRARELGYASQDTAEDWRDTVGGSAPMTGSRRSSRGGACASRDFTGGPSKVP